MTTPATSAPRIVRRSSRAGPCLTEGLLVRETPKFFVVYDWKGGNKFSATERRVGKGCTGKGTGAGVVHAESCPSCRDHAKTMYPDGYMD